ncbi:hypothetical protein [Spirillospora albida]|uniref:hypothetical protein n=1 Tax=Spirillospora albida TaxID=58123 RepID=UPI0004C1D57E|nr:hypothetical protein [Spirillospora albida]
MSVIVDMPHPSPAEALHAEYGHTWNIWRQTLPDGRHGDWLAEPVNGPEDRVLRAPNVEALAVLLRAAEA